MSKHKPVDLKKEDCQWVLDKMKELEWDPFAANRADAEAFYDRLVEEWCKDPTRGFAAYHPFLTHLLTGQEHGPFIGSFNADIQFEYRKRRYQGRRYIRAVSSFCWFLF